MKYKHNYLQIIDFRQICHNTLSFLCVFRSIDSFVSYLAVINISIGSGVITTSAVVNNGDFQVGSTNEWGMIYPVSLTYNLA